MKKGLLFLATLLTAAMAYGQNPEYLPEWKEGYLDIHTIATGRGDAALVIMPDGTTLMIDAGDNAKKGDTQHPDATKLPSEWQAIYMKHFMSQLPDKDNLDYAMITHFHNDHMGTVKDMIPGNHGYGLSGITLVGERIHFNKLVDRGWPNYDFPSKEKVLGANKGFMPEYIRFAQYSANHGTQMEKFEVGSKNQFTLVHNPKPYAKNFEIRNLASSGEVWTGKGTKSRKMYSGDPMLFDENMNSCAIRLRYGKFTYYNGGDLSGGNWPELYKSHERDFETQVGNVCGKVTVMKANHHGYYETCNARFLESLSPQVIIIDARSQNHPVPSTMTRMSDPQVWTGERECSFYITVDQARKKLGEELWSKFKPWGHIVVRVYPGGNSYQMFVLDADSTDYHIIYKSEVINL